MANEKYIDHAKQKQRSTTGSESAGMLPDAIDNSVRASPVLSKAVDEKPFSKVEMQWRIKTYQSLVFLIKDFRAKSKASTNLLEAVPTLPAELPNILRFLAELVKEHQLQKDATHKDSLIAEGARVLRHILLIPGVSHYRVLGLPDNAPFSEITNHYQWLRKVFLYDEAVSPQHDGTLRVTEAYTALKSSSVHKKQIADNKNSLKKSAILHDESISESNVNSAKLYTTTQRAISSWSLTSKITTLAFVAVMGIVAGFLIPNQPEGPSIPSSASNVGELQFLDQVAMPEIDVPSTKIGAENLDAPHGISSTVSHVVDKDKVDAFEAKANTDITQLEKATSIEEPSKQSEARESLNLSTASSKVAKLDPNLTNEIPQSNTPAATTSANSESLQHAPVGLFAGKNANELSMNELSTIKAIKLTPQEVAAKKLELAIASPPPSGITSASDPRAFGLLGNDSIPPANPSSLAKSPVNAESKEKTVTALPSSNQTLSNETRQIDKNLAALLANSPPATKEVRTEDSPFVVIGPRDLSVDRLTIEQVRDIFLGNTQRLPTGQSVSFVDHTVTNRAKDSFYGLVLKKSPEQMRAYWAKRQYGRDQRPPTDLPSDEAIKAQVASSATIIGYIDSQLVDDTIKVLLEP